MHQDVKSLADQIALCEDWVRREYSGPVEFTPIQGKGSGEHLDREDFLKAEDAVASKRYDLVVVEDLGRICRRNRAMQLCEEAEDAGTRLVAINDQVDTAAENLRMSAFFATFKHEMSNKDTAARPIDSLKERIRELEARKLGLELEKSNLARGPECMPELPPIAELKERARKAVGRLDFDDPAFGRSMRRLIPRFVLVPYVPRDGGHTVLRAHLALDLAPLLAPSAVELGTVLRRDLTVDLFDVPQRMAIRERALAMLATGTKQRQVAASLEVTQPAVQNALRLDGMMRAAGSRDPYVPLIDPANGSTKMARHRHPRFQFEPLPGFPIWEPVGSAT